MPVGRREATTRSDASTSAAKHTRGRSPEERWTPDPEDFARQDFQPTPAHQRLKTERRNFDGSHAEKDSRFIYWRKECHAQTTVRKRVQRAVRHRRDKEDKERLPQLAAARSVPKHKRYKTC